jgi:hypothetical protein
MLELQLRRKRVEQAAKLAAGPQKKAVKTSAPSIKTTVVLDAVPVVKAAAEPFLDAEQAVVENEYDPFK